MNWEEICDDLRDADQVQVLDALESRVREQSQGSLSKAGRLRRFYADVISTKVGLPLEVCPEDILLRGDFLFAHAVAQSFPITVDQPFWGKYVKD